MSRSGLRVVKVGGALVGPARVAGLAGALAAWASPCVLVHGGGTEVTELQRTLGVEPEWHDGLRVTGDAALLATIMVLRGTVSQRIVGALRAAGVDAAGISGTDAATIEARPIGDGRLGRVGEPAAVRTVLIEALLAAGILPVLAPVSAGADGPLNVNADLAAAAVAGALGAAELLLLTDVPGVRVGPSVARTATPAEAVGWIGDGTASAGMIPKLRAATSAAAAGVPVRIGPPEMLSDSGAGTHICAVEVAA